MDKVHKKSLKSSNRKERDLSKKIKNLTKQGKLEEELEIFRGNEIETQIIPIAETVKCDKKKKEKSKKKENLPLENVEENIPLENVEENLMEICDNTENMETTYQLKHVDNSLNSTIILNLPIDASKEELSNFLSKRDIPVESISIDNGKYAVIECEDIDALHKIRNLIANNPLANCSNLKASMLSGNSQRLSAFCQRNSIFNKNIVIVKNINVNTNIDDVLSLIPSDHEVRKHSVAKLHNKKVKTQMLTIEFLSQDSTEDVIKAINGTVVDNQRLSAQFKHKLVEDSAMEIQSLTLLLRDLPESTDYQAIKNLELPCTKIELVKKNAKRMCFLSFKDAKDVNEAFLKLTSTEVLGKKISVRFVGPSKNSAGADDVDNTKLQITNLPYSCTQEDIEKEFDMAQTVKFPKNSSGKSKGCCYLSFASVELAALAKEAFSDKLIGGRKIRCNFVHKKDQGVWDKEDKIKKPLKKRGKKNSKPQDNVVTLFNLPKTVTVEDIKPRFKHVKLVHLVRKEGDTFKGIAELHFTDEKHASVAVEGPEVTIGGRVIRMEKKGGKWREGTARKIRVMKSSRKKNEESVDE